MTRPAKVVIDIPALYHNLSLVRKLAPGRKVMAIVKADAYGHGLERIAKALNSVDAFGVACLEEAQQLRSAGITQAVLLLEGFYKSEELNIIHSLGLDIVVHSEYQVEVLEQVELSTPVKVWLKIDSGMNRLGFQAESVLSIWHRLNKCNSVASPLRVMTHFAAANDPANSMTSEQLQVFNSAVSEFDVETCLANSAAIIAWPDTHGDWVRPGLMLYGVSPLDDSISTEHGLRPVMSLFSELISIKSLKAGQSVGYGASWCCPEDMEVGIVAAGYGDGFPRNAKSGTPILVKGQRAAIIGNTSMDMITVDLRNIPNPHVGDQVELWGVNLPIEEIAEHAGTVAYELLTGVHKRLRFIEND